MNTGPKATSGYDLALTEVIGEGEHYFVVEVGSERGAEVLASVPHQETTPQALEAADAVVAETAKHMGRTMDTAGIKQLLYGNYHHPRWDDVASRCLTCANCTMVCPTCFCTTVEDVTDLAGDHAERWRKWDSCFTMDFSYIVGGSVRSSTKARYRQWMTHKLATWIDQFGTSGCVGCGRCITWCPVAIDITEEVRPSGNRSRSPRTRGPMQRKEAAMQTLEPLIKGHPFFEGLEPAHLRLVVGCARNELHAQGEMLFREGEEADWFYVIREGQLALEVHVPGRGPVALQTLSDGEVLGTSWLFPPYRWQFSARAVRSTRLLAFDGKCLRGKCDQDHDLGYELVRRAAQILMKRLDAARLQLLDLYGVRT